MQIKWLIEITSNESNSPPSPESKVCVTQHGRHAENKHGINTCALVLRDDPEMQINFVPLLPVVAEDNTPVT